MAIARSLFRLSWVKNQIDCPVWILTAAKVKILTLNIQLFLRFDNQDDRSSAFINHHIKKKPYQTSPMHLTDKAKQTFSDVSK